MPVPNLVSDLDTNANNNSPPGTESAKGNIDNYLRAAFAFIKQNNNLVAGTTAILPSSSTVAIGAAAVNNVTISGTATISAFDSAAEGAIRYVVFSGVMTLTHNATSLILPGAANIVTAINDTAILKSLGGGSWQCLFFQRGNGGGVVTSGVSSFNSRSGAITLTSADITGAGGALSSTSAGVSTFNTRAGAVTLTQADITSAGGAALNYSDATYFAKAGGTIFGNMVLTGTRISIANVSIAMSELHLPGSVAWGMFLSSGSNSLRWSTTNGGGVVVSENMVLGTNGSLWTSQIGDLATILATKALPGSVSAHATAVAEFGAVVAGFDNTVDCPAPYVMVGLRTVSGVSGQFIIRGVQLKST